MFIISMLWPSNRKGSFVGLRLLRCNQPSSYLRHVGNVCILPRGTQQIEKISSHRSVISLRVAVLSHSLFPSILKLRCPQTLYHSHHSSFRTRKHIEKPCQDSVQVRSSHSILLCHSEYCTSSSLEGCDLSTWPATKTLD
jgi:hypothetical protein